MLVPFFGFGVFLTYLQLKFRLSTGLQTGADYPGCKATVRNSCWPYGSGKVVFWFKSHEGLS